MSRAAVNTTLVANRVRALLLGVLAMLCFAAPAAPFVQADPGDSQLIAAFLVRFARYIEWPEGSPGGDSGGPLVIGVFADAAYLQALRRVASGDALDGRSVEVKELNQPDDLEGLSMVFLGTDDPLEIGQALSAAARESVLTVGYAGGFAERGGMVNFFIEERKMRFEVNVDAAQDQGIRLSSQLLRLAKIVSTGD